MAIRPSQVHTKALLAATLLVTIPTANAACNIINGKAHGDCTGVTVNQDGKAPLIVRGASSESNIIFGATVFSGGSLYLYGISNGDITIHKGGRLILAGVVSGTIRNLGGTVEVEGTVDHLFTVSGNVIVGGVVHVVSGPGAVSFRRGSVLSGTPFSTATKRSGAL